MTKSNFDAQPKAALRVKEMCARYGISRTTLYEEIAAGRLRAVKCGKATLIPCTSAEAWLNGLPAKAA
jgi:excisionase family DNA binding protein